MTQTIPRNRARFEVLVSQGQDAARRFTVGSRPLLIGGAPNNDLVLRGDGIDAHHALLWVEGNQVWIRDLDSAKGTLLDGCRVETSVPLPVGRQVCLGNAQLSARRCGESAAPSKHPYRLLVSPPDKPSARAAIQDIRTGRACSISSGNRVSVLYLLAHRLQEDRGQVDNPDDQGWCSNEELAVGVWGRNWRNHIDGHLYVLIHRLRKQIEQAGLDPWCIEKRHGASRICAQEIEIL